MGAARRRPRPRPRSHAPGRRLAERPPPPRAPRHSAQTRVERPADALLPAPPRDHRRRVHGRRASSRSCSRSLLLPLYTRYLTPADYGAAEVMLVAVIATSIVIRLRRHRGAAALLLPRRRGSGRGRAAPGSRRCSGPRPLGAAIALAFAGPISEALLDQPDAGLARIAISGCGSSRCTSTSSTLLRVDERARAYFIFTWPGCVVAIPLTVWLVVVEDYGRRRPAAGRSTARRPFRWSRGW